jgi:hypothetical protein
MTYLSAVKFIFSITFLILVEASTPAYALEEGEEKIRAKKQSELKSEIQPELHEVQIQKERIEGDFRFKNLMDKTRYQTSFGLLHSFKFGAFLPLSFPSESKNCEIFFSVSGLPVPPFWKYQYQVLGAEVGLRPQQRRGFVHSYSLGYRSIRLTADLSNMRANDESLAKSGRLTLSHFYLYPSLGWQWEIGKRLSIATEVGVLIPFFAKGSFSTDGTEVDTKGPQYLNTVSGLILPEWTFIRLTWH